MLLNPQENCDFIAIVNEIINQQLLKFCAAGVVIEIRGFFSQRNFLTIAIIISN